MRRLEANDTTDNIRITLMIFTALNKASSIISCTWHHEKNKYTTRKYYKNDSRFKFHSSCSGNSSKSKCIISDAAVIKVDLDIHMCSK